MRRVIAWVRFVLSVAGAAAVLTASGQFVYVGWRIRRSDSPLAGAGYLLPMALGALGVVLLLAAWRWRWALAGTVLAAVSFALSPALVGSAG